MDLIGEGVWRQKSPKTDLYLKPPAKTMRVTEQASWLNKTSFSKYLLSVALFILTLHRYHRSLKRSRNISEVFHVFFFFSLGRSCPSQLCSHPQNSFFAPVSLQRPTWTQDKAQILLLPPPPPPQRELIDLFSLVSLSAPLPYQNALAISPYQLYLVNLLYLDASGIPLLQGLGASLQSSLQLLHTISESAVAGMCNL